MSGSEKFGWMGGVQSQNVCEQALGARPAAGVIPTVVIARASAACTVPGDSTPREYKGIVYYDREPVAWYCVPHDKLTDFKRWAVDAFDSVQIVKADRILPGSINCPPPHTLVEGAAQAADGAARAASPASDIEREIYNTLCKIAASWFVPAQPVRSAKSTERAA